MSVIVLWMLVGAWGSTEGALSLKEGTGVKPQLTTLTTWYNVTLNGGFTAQGCGMKYTSPSSITVSGVPATATVTEAYLYWAVQNSTNCATCNQGNFNANPVVGTMIGSDVDPCWGQSTSWGYRADVTAFVPGNGVYTMDGFYNQGGSTPVATGASLFVIYSDPTLGTTDIAINEGNMNLPIGPLGNVATWDITGFNAPAVVWDAQLAMAVQDGQSTPDGTLYFNASVLDPGDYVYQGQDPPAGNFWDTKVYSVTALIPPASSSATVRHEHIPTGTRDCFNFIATILSVSDEPPTGVGLEEKAATGPSRLSYTGGSLLLTLPSGGAVRLSLYDAAGKRAAVLHDGELQGGAHRFGLPALPRGVYIALAETPARTLTAKLVR